MKIIIEGINIFRYDIPITQNSQLGYFNEYLKAFIKVFLYVLKINSRKKIDAIHVANPPEIFFPFRMVRKNFGF